MNKQSIITLVPYDAKKDRKNFIVQNKMTHEYFEMPALAVSVIRLLSEGNSIKIVQEKLEDELKKENTSVMEFMEVLIEMNFIVKIDDEEIKISPAVEKVPAQFLWIPPMAGKVFFNRVSVIIYFFVFLLTIILFMKFPALIPVYQDLFLYDLNMVNILSVALISLPFVLIHEAGHILAIRSRNLPARLEIGTRLFFIVLQTDLSEAWQLSPKNRTTLYLAGICFDIAVLFTCLILQLFFYEMELITGVLRLISLTTILRLLYQVCFFMKTDLYYVLENLTGVYNLMENSKAYLINKMPWVQKHEEEEVYEGEEWLVKSYSVLYVFGTVIMFGLLAVYSIPQLIFIVNIMFMNIKQPVTAVEFWDGFFVLLPFLAFSSFLAVSWYKKFTSTKEPNENNAS
ncbi:hypothetical protein [Rossellomorea aquimaris]|uniref:Peptidase n=1 Tax=Rossellomorea aquimaris TaxID=189382 RepID=A0A5D4U7V4_9BACI|nr:hypothetical protein [Rossellomorea aquimaris]TYS83211.1 hypothetical protein FZC80_02455 [Rossellomorea aquimaris]